jgi:hypothetical protein
MRYPREFLVEYLGNESYIQELLSCPSLQAFLENNSLIFKDKQTLFRKLTSLTKIFDSNAQSTIITVECDKHKVEVSSYNASILDKIWRILQ